MVRTAGLHIAGANAARTAIVVLSGRALSQPIELDDIYSRIGSRGALFGDERVVEILKLTQPLKAVFVDCPLSVPPCVACTRTSCPGAMHCDDVSVGYMLALNAQLKQSGLRKKRPINPQSQRLWDMMQQARAELLPREPSYSANVAPLVVRAQTLQRRLNSQSFETSLHETSVPHTLYNLAPSLGMSLEDIELYRHFEYGRSIRTAILSKLCEQRWLAPGFPSEEIASLEIFHAFVAALMAQFHQAGLTLPRPPRYPVAEGWVYNANLITHLPTRNH